MQTTTTSLDPIEVGRVVAGWMLDPAVASIVGPYAVIFLAAIGGGATALGNNRTLETRLGAFFFLFRAVLWGLLLTVPVATVVAKYSPTWEAQWFFIPAAAIVSYAADKWRTIFNFLIEQAKVLVRNWVSAKSPQDKDKGNPNER